MSTTEFPIHARAIITVLGMAVELVLAERPGTPQPFVTWIRNPHTGDYVWGHYFRTLEEARKDFAERLASYA
ncbi:hypothetical protein Sulac_1210 [Sulfobacillus acidophilus DSM 10332]|uniref:Uncharacterized protein n=1 Tax=Sulfobacillus acidophilus (strain ATCC 700253 / DSM 10332 / NAL) TaxID=679936 RepID=G8TV70_SULAD|nr:hypothetical protein Sulac_1210 [Sulfobacillus acidophilus DSM 10332]